MKRRGSRPVTQVTPFGTGAYGRLGLGSGEDQQVPVTEIRGALKGREIACVSAGLYHSAVVTKDNNVFVFGSNATACMGDQTVGDGSDASDASVEGVVEEARSYTPSRVRSLFRRIQIVQVAVGGDLIGSHSLAVSSQGRLYAWGLGKACGVGPGIEVVPRPTLVSKFVHDDLSDGGNSGRQIATLERVVFAAAGGSCSAVITAEGALFTFGITAGGRLGHERKKYFSTIQWVPKRVDALLGKTVVAVAAGTAHMVCVTQRGHLYTWGDNSRGQLGTGDLVDKYAPVRVLHPKHSAWAPIVAAGQSHTVAADLSGKVWVWGLSASATPGIAGCGERDRALCISFQIPDVRLAFTRPAVVPGLSGLRIAKLAAGAGHTVAVSEEGWTFAWGSKPQLGIPLPIQQAEVPRLVGLHTSAVSCGMYHTLLAGSGWSSLAFDFLIDSMQRALPAACHDASIPTKTRPIWICSSAIRATVPAWAWRSFWLPQIQFLSSSSSQPNPDSLDGIAHDFLNHAQATPEQRAVEAEYAQMDKLLDDWVRASSVRGGDSGKTEGGIDIPSECYFASLSWETVVRFLTLVLSDSLPELGVDGSVEAEQSVHALLKLGICSGLARPVALLKQRQRRMDKDKRFTEVPIPPSKLEDRVESLYNDAVLADSRDKQMVYFACGDPKFRTADSDSCKTTVAVHAFVAEAAFPALVLPGRDGESDSSPARLRAKWGVRIDQGCCVVECFDVAVDVFQELAKFVYVLHFDESMHEFELQFEAERGDMRLRFWSMVVEVAELLGCAVAAAAATDKLVGMLTDSNWDRIATIASGAAAECAVAIGTRVVSEAVVQHPIFAGKSGYVYAADEVRGAVERTMIELQNRWDSDAIAAVLERVVGIVSGQCHLARQLRRQLEHYQGLNADPVADQVKPKSKRVRSADVARAWIKSFFVPMRGEASLANTARDLALVTLFTLAAVTYFTAPSGTILGTRISRFFARNELFTKLVVAGLNLVFLAIGAYLMYRGLDKSGKLSQKRSTGPPRAPTPVVTRI